MAPVLFWEAPRQYIRYCAREKPALFWSVVVGCIGPPLLVIVPPIRERFGDGPRPRIPLTYPIPNGPRKKLTGYDDK